MNEEPQAPAPQTPQSPQEEKKVVTSTAQDGSKGSKKGLVIALVILFLILIGGGSFYFARSRSQAEPTPTPTPIESPTPTPEVKGETAETPTPTKKPTNTLTPKPTPTQTPTPTVASQTLILSASASLDGWRASNAGGNNTWYIQAGRNNTLVERGFVSFDITSIPAGKTIELATLRLYQTEVVGDPYGSLGSLRLDHLNYGDSLEGSDYDASSISASFATLTSNAAVEWKDANVTDRLKDDIANSRSRSQYRLRFTTEATGADAWARFESANNSIGTGNTPQLVVRYH